MTRGAGARNRRSHRRLAGADAEGVSKALGVDPETVTRLVADTEGFAVDLATGRRYEVVNFDGTFVVSGSTRLPLSDRETAWDSGAAKRTLSEGQYGAAHFYRDPDGDPSALSSYKLPFATAAGGTLTAVWRGVTAAAAALQGSRGGVDIPESDVAGVKARIAAYYRKAADQYDDPSIAPPWEASADPADLALDAIAAYAEAPPPDEADYAEVDGELRMVGFVPSGQAVEDALGALTVDTPHAADLVRDALQALVERRFAEPAAPLRPPPDGGPGTGVTLQWNGILAPEGRMTDDGRAFAPDAIEWRDLPLSLAAMLKTADGHEGAEVCGKIDRIWRDPNSGLIRGEGTFMDTEFGWRVAEMVANGELRGNSVDIAIHDVMFVPASWFFDRDGGWAPTADGEAALAEGAPEFDPFETSEERMIYLVTKGVIGMSTVCPFPAFSEATIESGLSASGSPFVWTSTHDAGWQVERSGSVTAAAAPAAEPEAAPDMTPGSATWTTDGALTWTGAIGPVGATGAGTTTTMTVNLVASPPVCPPAEWFDDPNLAEATPLTVEDTGRIFGHAALWGSCHTGFPDVCITPPRSETGYRQYHLKTVRCADGTDVECGTITLRGPHANQNLGRVGAQAHYDHTGTAVADVRVGEDDHGIWVAGALRPNVDEATVRELRGAVLSGDWRNYEGHLELIALLAVNVPGFPVPRTRAVVAGGQMQTLIAAGWATFTDATTPAEAPEEDGAPLTEFQRSILRALAARDLAELARR